MKQGRFRSLTLLPAADLRSAETEDRTALGLKWRMGVDAGKGRLTFRAGNPATLEIAPGKKTPDWIELRWVSRGRELCGFGHVILRLETAASAPCLVHPALRLRLKEGYRDIFGAPVRPGTTPEMVERTLALPPDPEGATQGVDLHLFFDPAATSVALHSLSLTALRP